MTEEEMDKLCAEWLLTRPACVQALVKEFPPGSRLRVRGRNFYVLGWTKHDTVIVAPFDPETHYEEALAHKEFVCARHYRPGGDGK